jgi:outer membrane receptor protein involved in Fe transport
MIHLRSKIGRLAGSSVFLALATQGLLAQSAPQPTPAQPDPVAAEEDTLVLDPFTVEGEEDKGYAATSTLAGTRIRTELKDVSSSISVVTKQFLQDTGSKNQQDLLVYTTNTEVGGVLGNFSGNGGGLQFNEDRSLLRPSNNTRVRGLDAADNTRNYFLTEIPWDGYNVDRVDLQRGPNSILFGVGSPAGIINTSLNNANFKNKNTFETRVDQFGSWRNSLDVNYAVIPNELAIRVAALDDNSKYRQEEAFNHDKRLYAAINFRPKLFGSTMSIKANVESGEVDANRPRTLPPVDAITPWFLTGNDSRGNPNLNKAVYNRATANKSNPPYSNNPWLRNGAIGRQFWNDVTAFYGNMADGSPTLLRQTSASGARGIGPNGLVDRGIGGLPQGQAFAIASYSSYTIGAGIPGGSFYADRSLADPTVFDFYNHLLDGDNKREWQEWDAANIAISQTFLNDRVGIEAVYDYQRYADGQRVFLGNSDTYKIGVDINSHFQDGTPNPNVGRAFVANSDEQANSYNTIDRDSLRFTAFAELRADDFLEKGSTLSKILGRHVFTGLLSEDKKRSFNKNWATSAAKPAFAEFTGEDPSLTGHHRSFNYMAYISGDLRSRASASGAGLVPVGPIIKAPKSAQVLVFDQTWNKPTNPSAAGYVDPAAPFTFTPQNFGLPGGPTQVVTTTQSENPANYVGWRTTNVEFLRADDGDIDALTYNAGRSENVIDSQSITWQGYLFDGDLVPVFGWRKDKIENSAGSPTPDALGLVNTNFGIDPNSVKITEGESTSYGVVAHLPKRFTPDFLGNTRISAIYNKSENFKADAPRGDVFGNTIANPIGETEEYGAAVSMLDDRLVVKATWYETRVANATLPGSNPLGQNSYFLWAVPAWGTAFVTNADQGIKGNNDNNSWAWNYAANDDPNAPQFRNPDGTLNQAWQTHPSTVKLKAAIQAWRQIPLNQQFFNAYGNEVALIQVDAIRAGDWTRADPIWNKKFDNQPISGGLLAGFGSPPVFTVDTLSKGVEIEVVAKPTKNWNVAVNASKTFATRDSLAPTIANLITDMTKFLNGPAGDIRLWGGGASNALRDQWQREIVNPYGVFKAQEGSNSPEIAPWRFNGTSTYSFDSGALKGSWVGGAFRWEQARVLGYQYSPTLQSLDISKPWKGDAEEHFDLWLGHSRKVTDRINWRIQLNLRNVGESKGLKPVSINPDGSVAFSRISEGMVWQLTNTFEF